MMIHRKKVRRFCLVYLLLILFQQFVGTAIVSASSPSGQQLPNSRNRQASKHYALLIGIGEYRFLPRLTSPVNNARLLEHALKVSQFPGEIILLTDVDATKAKIIQAIQILARKMESNDSLLFYYSGHGGRATLTLRSNQRPGSIHTQNYGKNIYDENLMPHDSTYASNRQISRDELARLLKALPSDRVTLIIDSAYDRSAMPVLAPVFEAPNAVLRPRVTLRDMNMYGYNVLMSADWNELAWGQWMGNKEYGVFTFFLCQGISTRGADVNRDGKITGRELFDWANFSTLRNKGIQHPQMYSGRDADMIVWE